MTLDDSDPSVTIAEAMQHARDDLIQQFEAFAKTEEANGDGRAARLLARFLASIRRKA